MKNKYIGAVLVLAVLVGGLYTFSNYKRTSNSIKIGVIIPITGKASSIGEPSNKLMILAQEDLRRAYPDSNLQIVVEDGAGDVKTSVTAAQKLLNVDKVDALYVVLTGPAMATLPLAQQKNVVFAFSAFTDAPLTTYDKSLKTFIDYRDLCSKQGVSFTNKGYTKVVTVSENNGLAELCKDALSSTFKGEVKIINIGADTDVKSEMLKLKQEGYQAIVSTAYEANMTKIIKTTNETSYKPEIICNIAVCATSNIKSQFTNNQLSNITIHATGVSKAFLDKYTARYENIPAAGLTNPAFDFEMVMDIAEGLIACGKNNPDCVIAKTQTTKAETGGLINYVWKNRSMIPDLEWYGVVDGNLVRK